jgi:hypothetical protein
LQGNISIQKFQPVPLSHEITVKLCHELSLRSFDKYFYWKLIFASSFSLAWSLLFKQINENNDVFLSSFLDIKILMGWKKFIVAPDDDFPQLKY